MSDELFDDLSADLGRLDDLPDPGQDPTAALLRSVLVREAERVQPAPDGLARIRAAVATETGSRGSVRPRRRRWAGAATVLAAAASVVLLAGGAVFAAQNLGVLDKSDAATVQPVKPRTPSLPVYVVGALERDGRVQYRLFREYHPTGLTNIDARLTTALTDAVASRPEDADYDRVFGGAGGETPVVATWDAANRTVRVELTPAMTTVRRASDDRAFIAIQQIVYTATAVVGDADAAVRITVRQPALDTTMFGRPNYPLGGVFYRAHGNVDPSAPVWLVDPVDGTTLGRKTETFQVNVGYTARDGVPWTLTRNGKEVASGTASVGFTNGRDRAVPGNRGVARITVDHTEPGVYELTISEPPSVGDPPWTDSKTFVVN